MDFEQRFEIFANEQAADVEALTEIVKALMATVLHLTPDKVAAFQAIRSGVVGALAGDATRAGADPDAKRKAEFVLSAAQRFFDEMAPAFGSKPSGSSGPTN